MDLDAGETHHFARLKPGIAVCWHPDRNTLVVTCENGMVWLLEDGGRPGRLLEFDEPARGAAWHASGLLAVGDAGGNLVLLDGRRQELWTTRHEGETVALCWRPQSSNKPELLVGTRGKGAHKYTFSVTYLLQPMTQEQAVEIAYHWHYDGMYAFYDAEADAGDLEEFVDPEQRGDRYFAVLDGSGDLVGFFGFDQACDQACDQAGGHVVELGLGMRPDLTGKGNGLEFVEAGLEFARQRYAPDMFTLSVATFNERAIRVYEKAGFKRVRTFVQETNGGQFEFLGLSRQL